MKIISVDIIRINSGRGPVKGRIWNPTVVRINTDEGISGIGEIGLAYSPARHGSFGVCQDFSQLIIGKDPIDNEVIWEDLFNSTFWVQGGGGFVFGAVSAIDIALWDIRGKVFNAPIYKLLGGKVNKNLRTYASQLQLDWGEQTRKLTRPEEYAEAALKAIADGYSCIKVNPFMFDENGNVFNRYTGLLEKNRLKMAIKRIEAIRQAGGSELDIIIELHARTDINSAIQICDLLQQYSIYFCEEATTPLSADNMLQIANNVKIPLASGERIYSRWGYRPFFENKSLRIIQPDLGNCGGITEGKKIADMAKTYEVSVQAHICGSPVANAAALQFEAAIPSFMIHEHHAVMLMNENISLGNYNYQPKNGYYDIPDLPGLGIELSEYALKGADILTIR